MNKNSLVSILLPVSNASEKLSSCLDSLTNQTYENIEIIAIDDNSRDNSFKTLKEYAKKDKRIRVYKNVKKYGRAVTLNRLIKKTKGEFVTFMDSCDSSSTNRIKRQILYLLKNKNTVAVGTQCLFVDENNKKLGKSNFPQKNRFIYQSPLHGISMQFETVLINRTLIPKDILKFSIKSKPFIYSDVFIKLLPYGKFANLKEILYKRRSNPGTYSTDLRKHPASLIKLWIKSVANYNYHPSIRFIFAPLGRN